MGGLTQWFDQWDINGVANGCVPEADWTVAPSNNRSQFRHAGSMTHHRDFDLATIIHHEFLHTLITAHTRFPSNMVPYRDFWRKPVLNGAQLIQRRRLLNPPYSLSFSTFYNGIGLDNRWNSRGVFDLDADRMMTMLNAAGNGRAYNVSYPMTTGLIRMQRGDGPYYLTSDWREAQSRMIWPGTGAPTSDANLYFVVNTFAYAGARSQIAAGNTSTAALKQDGTAWSAGDNTYGQNGKGGTAGGSSNVPVQASTSVRFTSISSTNCHTQAIAADGRLFAWGCNGEETRLGDNSTTHRTAPVEVCANSAWTQCFGNRYAVVSAGGNHTLAIRKDGTCGPGAMAALAPSVGAPTPARCCPPWWEAFYPEV